MYILYIIDASTGILFHKTNKNNLVMNVYLAFIPAMNYNYPHIIV